MEIEDIQRAAEAAMTAPPSTRALLDLKEVSDQIKLALHQHRDEETRRWARGLQKELLDACNRILAGKGIPAVEGP